MAGDILNRRIVPAALPTVSALITSTARAESSASLDGFWEGDLTAVSGPAIAPPPSDDATLRLLIRSNGVQVSMSHAGVVTEMNNYPFRMRREGANAVIDAILSDPGAPRGLSWVEPWTCTVTLADQDTLNLAYVRMVNNNGMRPEPTGSRFTQVRVGQMHRVADHV